MSRRDREEDRVIREPLLHLDHARPVTRRQFLGQGFLAGTAVVAIPTVGSLLMHPSQARAAMDCALGGGAPHVPYIGFDLAGGANVAGSNVLVGTTGQLETLSLNGYKTLGLPEELTPQRLGDAVFNDELGLLFHQDSAMLRGILNFTSPETRLKVNGAVICARSANDTSNNQHNPIYGINKAGSTGGLIQLAGTSSSDSGGRSMVPEKMFDPALRPTKIDRPSDARGLVDTGELVDMLGQAGAGDVMGAVETLSKSKIGLMGEDTNATDLMTCAYEQSTQLVIDFGDPNALDPLMDEDIAPQAIPGPNPPVPIFATQDVINDTSEYRKVASVMKLVVEGKAGCATIEFGGYDYHNSTRATGERKDERAGEAIGAALEFAARRGQDLMIYVFSDGSVASDGVIDGSPEGRDKGIWKGDNSGTAAVFMLVLGRTVRPTLRNGNHQIGIFRDSAAVETSHPGASAQISNAPDLLAEAIVLNYLALHGREGEYAAVMASMDATPGLTGNLDELMAFNPIR
jgi:hypothetical protein